MSSEPVSIDVLSSQLESSIESYGPIDLRVATHYYCYGKALIKEALSQQEFFLNNPTEETAKPSEEDSESPEIAGKSESANPFETAYTDALLKSEGSSSKNSQPDNPDFYDDFQIGWESLQASLNIYLNITNLNLKNAPKSGIPEQFLQSCLQLLIELITVGYRTYQFESIIEYGRFAILLIESNPIYQISSASEFNPFTQNHQFSLLGFFHYYIGQSYLVLNKDTEALDSFSKASTFFLARIQVISKDPSVKDDPGETLTWQVFQENQLYNAWKSSVSAAEKQFGALVDHQNSYIPLSGELPVLEYLYNQINPRINKKKNKKRLEKGSGKATKIAVNSLFFADRVCLVLSQYLYEIQITIEDKLALDTRNSQIRQNLLQKGNTSFSSSSAPSAESESSTQPPPKKKTKRLKISMNIGGPSETKETM